MFDWIGDLIDAIAEAIREAFEFLGTQISNTIWNTMAPMVLRNHLRCRCRLLHDDGQHGCGYLCS